MGTAAVIAAVAVAAERRIVDTLRAAGAHTPAAAIPLTPSSGLEAKRLQLLLHAGAVRSTGDGRYYLDDAAWEAHLRHRRRLASTLITGMLLALLVLLVLLVALRP